MKIGLKNKKLRRIAASILSFVMVVGLLQTIPGGILSIKANGEAPSKVGNGKIDVVDFGAEQMDESKYNNLLTEDVANALPSTKGGTLLSEGSKGQKGVNIASFTIKDNDGNDFIKFNDGSYNATHRIRTTNTNINRYDEKNKEIKGKDSEGKDIVVATYNGYLYANKSSTPDVNMQFNLTANDVLTVYLGSNSGAAIYKMVAPDGTETDISFANNASTPIEEHEYYAPEDGVYTLYCSNEKMVVARVTREHKDPVKVTGKITYNNNGSSVEAPENYSVIFTNNKTGVETEADILNDGTYSVYLYDGYEYTASLKNADIYVISSEASYTAKKDVSFDITINPVRLMNVTGKITGLDSDNLNKVKLSFDSDKIYVPVINIASDRTYTLNLESGVEYDITAEDVDDYELVKSKISATQDSTIDIEFKEKTTYPVTIIPEGAEIKNLANATFTFVRHSDEDVTKEENYQYTFKGTDGIALRDGVYTVKVTDSGDYKQKLTSNLKVNGAAVEKKVGFEYTGDSNAPVVWDFTSDEYTGQAEYNNASITGSFRKHGTQYGMEIKNGSVTVPVKGNSEIEVVVGYSWDITFPDGTKELQKPNGGTKSVKYDYNGEEGTVTLNIGSDATTYIAALTVTPVSSEASPTAWDFTSDEYTGQAEYNKASIKGSFSKHGKQYGMQIKNGSVTIPVDGAATITVGVGYTWDLTLPDGTNKLQTTDGGMQELTFDVSEAGKYEIKAGTNCTSYISSIKVELKDVQAKTIVLTVGKDKQFATINEALAAARKLNASDNKIIEIDPGNYEEMLVIDVDNITLKNTNSNPSIRTINKGVDIEDSSVRITSYYGHGYTYYSMGSDCKYSDEILNVNKENGYPSFVNPGSGTTNGSYWNATVVVSGSNVSAEGIIFENSFNQYVSEKAANDIIVAQSVAKEGTVARASMKAGDTTVQDKKYVERAAALAIKDNAKQVYFNNCSFIGRQDTLYGGTNSVAAFNNCSVYGGTDYIFGAMTAVFNRCNLVFNTSEDSNDVGYITAAQQKGGRGYLMYNCTVTSTVPGVDTASEYTSKPGYLGRPWQANTSEVVYYNTVIEAADEKWGNNTSLIQKEGWNSTLSGTSDNVYEYNTMEIADVDNTASRVSWSNVLSDSKLKDGTAISREAYLGDWKPYFDDEEAGSVAYNVNDTDDIKVETSKDAIVSDKDESLATFGYNVNISLNAKVKNPTDSEKTAFEETVTDGKLGTMFSVSVDKTIGTKYNTAISTAKEPLKITVKIPDSLTNVPDNTIRTYKIAKSSNGKTSVIDSKYDENNKTLVFETDEFATYAIVYCDESTVTPEPDPTPDTDTTVSVNKSEDAPDIELTDSKEELINKIMSDDFKKKAEGKNVKINLTVEKMQELSNEETRIVEKIMTDNEHIGLLLNINLNVDIEGSNTSILNTADAIKLSIDVPQNLVNKDAGIERTYSVLRIHDGNVDVLKAVYNNDTNKITFETDKFSTYVLVYEDTVKNTTPENPATENPSQENPTTEAPSADEPATEAPAGTEIKDGDKSAQTGDKSPIAALITMLGLSGLGIFASTKKKRV